MVKYVLRRAKTLQGIYALGKIEHKHVRANREVHEEYERLRNTVWYGIGYSSSYELNWVCVKFELSLN